MAHSHKPHPSNKRDQQQSPKSVRTRTLATPISANVQSYKAAYMQRIADHVRLGYVHWTAGTVAAERAHALVRKFHIRYGTGRTRHQKAYARSLGQASAVLMLWGTEPGILQWALMATPGENLAHDLEKLNDATTAGGRVVLTGYELVQLPRRGSAQPSWTWRMTAATYEAWRERILRGARHGPEVLSEHMKELARTPGFAGCRAQVRKLLQLASSEARRRLGAAATTVSYPTRIGYVQRLSQTGTPLSTWVRQQRAASGDVPTPL